MMSKTGETAIRLRTGISMASLALAMGVGLLPSSAHAQAMTAAAADQSQDQEDPNAPRRLSQGAGEQREEDIVVTGTLIRGTAPVGSNSLSLGQQRIEELGAVSSNDVLASVPQVSNFFNNVPLAQINSLTSGQVQTTRPNIRSIGNSSIAVSPTLVLVNGHRIAGVGVRNSNVDPDLIAVGAIERIDVVTEGGSATYGADAVAGVINFITRRRFEGVRVDGSYGFADNYSQWNVNATAGHMWDTGAAFIAYSYAHTDALYGRDRDYIQSLDYTTNPAQPINLTCASPNLTLSTLLVSSIGGNILGNFGNVPYAAPGFAPNTANRCDNSENSTIVPESERHSVFAGLTQELGPRTTVDVHGFYGRRETESRSEAVGIVALGASNPAAASLPSGLTVGPTCVPGIGCSFFGFPFENRALVNFSFSPVLGPNPLTQRTLIEEWGADLELTHNIDDNWQIRGLASYSESGSYFNAQEVNAARLAAAGIASTPATAINPINIAATNRALIDDLIDSEDAGEAHDRLLQFRAILEGRLFTLPGGDVRLAVGAEYLDDTVRTRLANDIRRGALESQSFNSISRDVKSVFGELQVPLVGADNARPGLYSLVLSAAVRYDDYSDFGGTTNPKFGITYEPVRGFRIRGNWGTSFTAPSLIDLQGGVPSIGVAQTHPFQPIGVAPPANSYDVIITGTRLPLQPQTADTWSVGVDLEPTAGWRVSMSYYDVVFSNIISIPTPSADIFTDFSSTNFVSATGLPAAQVRAFASQISGGQALVDPLLAAGAPFYSLIDFRVGNYGILHVSGLDFSTSYRRETRWGSFDLAFNGNLQLRRDEQVSPLSGSRDRLLVDDNPEFTFQASAGFDIGTFRAQATWNHNDGFGITPTTSFVSQTEVGSFDTVNLFFKYVLAAQVGPARDVTIRLNINNVFDAEPPVLRRSQPGDFGFLNGFTLGRLVQVGVSTSF